MELPQPPTDGPPPEVHPFFKVGPLMLVLGSLSASALLMLGALASIASLYPPERRARNELQRFLGGPLPASARDITLHYEGGIDPTRTFEFSLASADYAAIRHYRNYTPTGGLSSSVPMTPSTLQSDEPGNFYYLDYDAARQRCNFRVFNY